MTSENDPSGHALAEAAHAAGAVEPSTTVPNFELSLTLVVRGQEELALEIAERAALELAARSDVTSVSYSVRARDPEAG